MVATNMLNTQNRRTVFLHLSRILIRIALCQHLSEKPTSTVIKSPELSVVNNRSDGSPWPIKMCFYYSHCVDWQEDGTHPHNYQYVKGPDAELFQTYFENKFFPQVKELMVNYGDVGLIWFDVPESGEYSITILYSAHRNLARDKKNDIHLDGKPVLSFATQATRGASPDPWTNFEDHVVGRMSTEEGRRNLALVPQPKQDGRKMPPRKKQK